MNIADTLSGSILDKQYVKDQLGARDTVIPVFKAPHEDVTVFETYTGYSPAFNDDFVLDHSVNGALDDSSIYLDNTTRVQGASLFVINKDNTFYENFDIDTFKDSTNTTATWDTTNHQASLAPSEVLQTDYIYKDNNTVGVVVVELGNLSSSTDLQVSASTDGGTTWESLSLQEKTTLTNTGTSLKLKITNNSSTDTITFDSILVYYEFI